MMICLANNLLFIIMTMMVKISKVTTIDKKRHKQSTHTVVRTDTFGLCNQDPRLQDIAARWCNSFLEDSFQERVIRCAIRQASDTILRLIWMYKCSEMIFRGRSWTQQLLTKKHAY